MTEPGARSAPLTKHSPRRTEQTIDLREPAAVGSTHSGVFWIDTERFTAMLAPPPAAPSGALWLATRVGVALLLVTNAVYAFAVPEDFESLLQANPIGARIDDDIVGAAVALAGVNDAILAVLVLARRWQGWVWCWLGAWFAIIAMTKWLNLVT